MKTTTVRCVAYRVENFTFAPFSSNISMLPAFWRVSGATMSSEPAMKNGGRIDPTDRGVHLVASVMRMIRWPSTPFGGRSPALTRFMRAGMRSAVTPWGKRHRLRLVDADGYASYKGSPGPNFMK
jgi:hypothetical protein